MKKILFCLGWALLVGGFFAGAAEPLAHSTGFGVSRLVVPAYDLWYTISPRTLVLTQIRVERYAPLIWDPLMIAALQLPAWLLLGIPGGLLAWFCRPYRPISDEMREDLEHYRQSLLIIETLSREARKDETYDPNEDDNAPTHLLFDLDQSEDEDMRDAYRDGGLHANYASFDGFEAWHRGVTIADENNPEAPEGPAENSVDDLARDSAPAPDGDRGEDDVFSGEPSKR